MGLKCLLIFVMTYNPSQSTFLVITPPHTHTQEKHLIFHSSTASGSKSGSQDGLHFESWANELN
jgi:hypothetical protein